MLNFNPNDTSVDANIPDDPNGTSNTPETPAMPIPPRQMAVMPPEDDAFDPDEYLINYNKEFADGSPILFRDNIIQQTISCLIGKFKPNALLIGAAGTGKTKIAEDIARRLATQDALIPDQLEGYTIWELPISNILSGSGLLGEIERKTKNILKFAQDPENKVILFIDEIHMLVSGNQSYDKIAQIMKPALARGNMKVIGATTLQEAQNLMDDPAFNRRFTRLIVDELSQDHTKEILKQISGSLFDHYEKKIVLDEKVLDEIVTVADDYKTMGSHRPDNAITLLDRVMADALIHRKAIENKAIMSDDIAMMQELQETPVLTLSRSQMKKTALKIMTGNNEQEMPDFDLLQTNLSVIKGQDDIIRWLIDTLRRDSLNLYPRIKPLTVLFAGNSGVGKSEIAKIIAYTLTGVKPIILNMTEYHSDASINRIIGSPAGYVGSNSKSELPFDILESNPYQVILLDEFEKSDKSVQRLFMSAFDEGYIKTQKGKTVDFSKSIIIATTNAGHTTKGENIGFTPSDTDSDKATVTDLAKFFDVELLNRFTKVLDFHPITKQLFTEILMDVYERDVKSIKAKNPSYEFLPDTLSDNDRDSLVKEYYNKEFGARPVKKAVQKFIEDLVLNRQNSASRIV